MRSVHALWLSLALAACGDDAPSSPQGTVAAEEFARSRASRPLAAADVETFLAVYPTLAAANGDPAAMRRALERHGADPDRWHLTQTQIMLAYTRLMMADMDKKPVPEAVKADAEVVRPFVARISAAIGGK